MVGILRQTGRRAAAIHAMAQESLLQYYFSRFRNYSLMQSRHQATRKDARTVLNTLQDKGGCNRERAAV